MRKYRLIVLLALCAFAIRAQASFEIVAGGEAKAVVVIPDAAPSTVQRAAFEIVHHVAKASGVELAVLGESAAADSPLNKLYLGKVAALPIDVPWDEFNRNGCYYLATPDEFFIVGRDEGHDWRYLDPERGTLQGVCRWLERDLGVRWLWPGELGEAVPPAGRIAVAEGREIFNQPIVSSRIHPSFRSPAGWSDPEAFQRFTEAEEIWEMRHGFSWYTPWRAQHSFGLWKYWERFGESHPEYFNLLPDGTRRPDPLHVVGGAAGYVAMCPSSPGLVRQVVADWQANRHLGFPWGPNLYLGENDTSGSCCCAECLALDNSDDPGRVERARRAFLAGDGSWPDELGDVSGRYIHFYREVLKLAREIDPEVKVVGWANYANYSGAPAEPLGPDMVMAFVSPLMYPWTPEKIAVAEKSWKNWADSGALLILRPNFMLDGHNMPVNFAPHLAALYQYCLANNMAGTEFDSNTGQYASDGLNMYTLARLTRSPELSAEQILGEFCDAFGPASGEIREFYAYWLAVSDGEITRAVCERARNAPVGVEAGGWNRFYTVAPSIYTPEVLAHGDAILERARTAAANDPEALARIEFLRKGIRHAELTTAAQRAFDTGDKFAAAQAIVELDRFRAAEAPNGIANMGYLSRMEDAVWDRPQLYFMLEAPGTPLPDGWTFRWDPRETGVAEGWFQPGAALEWQPIGIDTAWETQPVGKAWEAEHGVQYDGIGWYRITFPAPAIAPKERAEAILTFGAVDEACTVWLNGREVHHRSFPFQGNSDSWREPFAVDISDAVVHGADNLLVVRVEDRAGAGGIWRPVWLRFETRSDRPEILNNGGFAGGVTGWDSHVAAGDYQLKYDPEAGAALIECLGKVAAGHDIWTRAWARFYQTVTVDPAKSYDFHAKVKTDPGFSGNIRIWCLSEDQRDEAVFGDTAGLWAPVAITGIRPGGDRLSVFLNVLDGVGRVWFDEVSLTESAE